MAGERPSFTNPPVVETVLAVQFDPLPRFGTPHAGAFWARYLEDEWPEIKEESPIEDQFERFGAARQWGSLTLKLKPGSTPNRVQFVHREKERLIQVQPTRFVYNWRRNDGPYPRFDTLLPEFQHQFSVFQQFVADVGTGDLTLNQWEVTYVNHLMRGELWASLEDWTKILPSFSFLGHGIRGQTADGFGGEWHLVMPEQRGRLHINIQHVRVGGKEGPEAMLLQLTARGPLETGSTIDDLVAGLNLGRDAIVHTFTGITSDFAHKQWKRES